VTTSRSWSSTGTARVKRQVHIGCAGWAYPHWRERLYPKGLPQRLWLARYAERFDTVEVNNTFYRLPSQAAVEGWVEQSPPGFVFAVKASRYLTHVKRLREVPTYVRRFYESLDALTGTDKFGPVLWQFPENFHRNEDRLGAALRALPPGRHAFEFRHDSWFNDSVFELLREHGAALVIGDDPARPYQTPHERTADWTYIRFHRGNRGRGGNYSGAEIDRWARRFAQWRRETEIFAYFNNDQEGFAPRNAALLKEKLGV
jgi:uncharacterized protein YecE (DUF72 family)